MSKLTTVIDLVLHDRRGIRRAIANNFSRSSISHLLSDEAYLRYMFYTYFDKHLNFKEPKTFNEKLQWLKLYDRRPEYIKLVDKYEVKEYIAERIGADHIIPTLGVWDNFEDIDFDKLPDQFVLKCTHDSGSTIICRNKKEFDIEAARKKLNRKLNMNLFWHGREWPYKQVKPRIIAEKYMEENGEPPKDYKFFCFNGKVKCFKIDFDRFIDHKANYYDENKKLMHFGEAVCPPDFDRDIKIPENINEMIRLAELFSGGYPFIRVDFYSVNGQIYFGELTFFPASGFGPFIPDEWDERLGSWIDLPEKRNEE